MVFALCTAHLSFVIKSNRYVVDAFWQLAFVITDGKQSTKENYTRLSEASQGIKNKGVTVYALGVGNGVDRAELEEIASGPSYIFTSSSFSDLQSIAPRITKRLCAGRITDHVVFRAIILRFEKVLNISRVCSYTFFPFIPPPQKRQH